MYLTNMLYPKNDSVYPICNANLISTSHRSREKNKSDYSISHFVTLLIFLLFDEESMSFDQWSDTNKNILYYTNN